ncbi:F-box associated domain containing protein [Tanacetum coccineum]
MTLDITHWFSPEIIREILLKATVKSLLRCKSVCKEWFSLISDQHFIKAHYTLSSTNINYQHHRLIYNIYQQENNLNSCPLYHVLFDASAINVLLPKNSLQRSRALSIVGSCNGLVCLFVDDDDDFFIYNLSTRIWNGLPFRRGYSEHDWHSFGYDESTDDYKIVEIECLWYFSNGALHWVALDDSSSSYTQRIVSLDLSTETYGEVLQPEGGMNLSLGVLGEHVLHP